MNSLNVSVVVEPTHPMSSSNTKDKNIFRLANGNYISGLLSHRYLSPNESKWVMSNRKDN